MKEVSAACRQCRVVRLDLRTIEAIAKAGGLTLPGDWSFAGMQIDDQGKALFVRVHSDRFSPIPPRQTIPVITPTIRRETA